MYDLFIYVTKSTFQHSRQPDVLFGIDRRDGDTASVRLPAYIPFWGASMMRTVQHLGRTDGQAGLAHGLHG